MHAGCLGRPYRTHAASHADHSPRRAREAARFRSRPARSSGACRRTMNPGAPIQHIPLIGIGGSAMASLAGMLKERGYLVTGSDTAVYAPASTLLESLS